MSSPADEVHGGRADEAGDEDVVRPVVELDRAADLLDRAVAHHDDAVRHRHRLDLIVGDVDRRRPQPLVQFLDLGAHLHAELGVEVGERLVEEEDARVANDRAAHGHPLPLAAGELAREAAEERLQAEDVGGATDARQNLVLGDAAEPQRKAHVLRDPHMGIERVVLEDHGDVAFLRRNVIDDLVADTDLTAGDVFQTGDHA